MKRYLLLFLICTVGAGIVLHLTLFSGANASIPAPSSVPVQRKNLEDVVTALGKLEPAAFVDVGAQVSGQLMHIYVELGSVVEKGQVLAEIDPRQLAAQVEADKATLANLEAGLAQSKATLIQTRRNYERDRDLRKQNATSTVALQNSETAYKIAQAQVDALNAQIRQARATLESNEVNLSQCRVYAPISGTIVSLPVKEGQTLNNKQSAPVLMRIADLSVMTVWASVSEADVNKLHPGMTLYFNTLGDTATRHYAVLDKIHPSYTEDNDVILYDVVFNVENAQHTFFPAMNAQVYFVREQAQNVLTLPLDALPTPQKTSGTVTLQVLGADGERQERQVSLGVRTRTSVEVRSGLDEGDRVLVTPKPSAVVGKGGFMKNSGPRL